MMREEHSKLKSGLDAMKEQQRQGLEDIRSKLVSDLYTMVGDHCALDALRAEQGQHSNMLEVLIGQQSKHSQDIDLLRVQIQQNGGTETLQNAYHRHVDDFSAFKQEMGEFGS